MKKKITRRIMRKENVFNGYITVMLSTLMIIRELNFVFLLLNL